MSTRRDMAVALMGLPVLAGALPLEQESKPGPYSETSARIISYTLYAEARGESFAGKLAVASVIHTRATRSKLSLAEVCRQDKQFTCWNELKDVPDYFISGTGIKPDDLHARSECYGIAWVLMVSKRKWDYLTHFYNPAKATPSWASELKGRQVVGKHVFGYIE